MTESTPETRDQAAKARFSWGRVLAAVVIVIAIAAAVWRGSDAVAELRARALYAKVSKLIEGRAVGDSTYADLKRAVGLEPSRTMALDGGRYQLEYTFVGLNREYTIRIECWEFEDDPHWYLATGQLLSKRRL